MSGDGCSKRGGFPRSRRGAGSAPGGEAGFTLVEMMVVVCIAGILITLSTMQFSGMISDRSIESEARQLLSDLQTARTRALFSKRPTALKFPSASSYSYLTYSSVNEPVSAGTVVATVQVKVPLAMVDGSANGSPIAGQAVVFSREGNAYHADASTVWSPPLTVWVSSTSKSVAADSVVVDAARTSIGRTTNGSCIIK